MLYARQINFFHSHLFNEWENLFEINLKRSHVLKSSLDTENPMYLKAFHIFCGLGLLTA